MIRGAALLLLFLPALGAAEQRKLGTYEEELARWKREREPPALAPIREDPEALVAFVDRCIALARRNKARHRAAVEAGDALAAKVARERVREGVEWSTCAKAIRRIGATGSPDWNQALERFAAAWTEKLTRPYEPPLPPGAGPGVWLVDWGVEPEDGAIRATTEAWYRINLEPLTCATSAEALVPWLAGEKRPYPWSSAAAKLLERELARETWCPELLALTTDESFFVREAFLRSLGHAPHAPPEAIERYVLALEDPDLAIRVQVRRELTRRNETGRALRERVGAVLRSSSPERRDTLVRLLRRAGVTVTGVDPP